MDSKIWMILGLVASFFVGRQWDKIRKVAKPYAKTATQKVISGAEETKKFLEGQKEKASKAKAAAELQPISSDEKSDKTTKSQEG